MDPNTIDALMATAQMVKERTHHDNEAMMPMLVIERDGTLLPVGLPLHRDQLPEVFAYLRAELNGGKAFGCAAFVADAYTESAPDDGRSLDEMLRDRPKSGTLEQRFSGGDLTVTEALAVTLATPLRTTLQMKPYTVGDDGSLVWGETQRDAVAAGGLVADALQLLVRL